MTEDYDVIVAGAGMVGSALAFGLVCLGRRVLLLDGEDADYRAAKANFGLVWMQGKGYGNLHYQRLSLQAGHAWPDFAREIERESGIDLQYENRGGLYYCLGREQFEERARKMRQWEANTPEFESCIEMLDAGEAERRFPSLKLGPDVSGVSFDPRDGHVNPLRLLTALQTAFVRRGGALRGRHAVDRIEPRPGGGFVAQAGKSRFAAPKLVIAAGLGSRTLGPMAGLDVPLRPQRGQILVTERLAPLAPLPASGIRQTGDGTVMLGVTQEETGYDISTTTSAAVLMTRKAVRIMPALAGARLVRHWSCLRVMTPDGCPVYAESAPHPGAWIALCHSGVTLASFHAGALARAVVDGALPSSLDPFHHERFAVSQAE
jgi:glycine/D-amino acid oxidase-like deaminating enzyme